MSGLTAPIEVGLCTKIVDLPDEVGTELRAPVEGGPVDRCHWSPTGWALQDGEHCSCEPVVCPWGDPGDVLNDRRSAVAVFVADVRVEGGEWVATVERLDSFGAPA